MDDFGQVSANYFKKLDSRKHQSRAYTSHQALGVELAAILEDAAHTSLYIRLAKLHDSGKLLELARSIAERGHIENRGAYFMKVLHDGE